MKNFGKNFKKISLSLMLTQKEIGKETGYAESTVSDWENDRTEPNLSTVKKLVQFFKISNEDLFDF